MEQYFKIICMKRITPLLLVPFIFAACSEQPSQTKATDSTVKAEPVEVTTVAPQLIARDVEYTSTILAWEELHYAPASPGRIDQIFVEVGQYVKKGELLAQMDLTQLHQAEIQLNTLTVDAARFDTLNKTGSIAKQQYDQIQSQLEIAQSSVDFLRENTKLLAPFNGLISGKYYEAGELYSGAPIPTIGKSAILSLVQIDKLKLRVAISEKYFPMIRTGMPAKVTTDVYPDKVFMGKVFNIYPVVEPASRTFIIEISLENTQDLLRPGMFARANLELDQEEAILLPSIAILKLQGSNDRYLFIEKDGYAHRIPVLLGKRYDDMVEVITEELKAGDKVVTRGQARLLDGMRVEIK